MSKKIISVCLVLIMCLSIFPATAYLKALQKEYDDLKTSHTGLKEQLAAVNEELKPMKDIRYWVSKVLSPEQAVEKQPEPKHSLSERLKYEQEQKKQVQKAPKQKKHDMEL